MAGTRNTILYEWPTRYLTPHSVTGMMRSGRCWYSRSILLYGEEQGIKKERFIIYRRGVPTDGESSPKTSPNMMRMRTFRSSSSVRDKL